MSSSSKTIKRMDGLLAVHACVALMAGSLAFVVPHVFEYFFLPHGEALLGNANSGDASKLEHLTVRLYGALILAQAWIVWSARRAASPEMRRALVQAYAGAFALTAASLLRAQLTQGGRLSSLNWLNIALFVCLAAAYGYFAVFEKVAVFEGLGKSRF